MSEWAFNKTGRIQMFKIISPVKKHNFAYANSTCGKTVCKLRKGKITWGENNSAYDKTPDDQREKDEKEKTLDSKFLDH